MNIFKFSFSIQFFATLWFGQKSEWRFRHPPSGRWGRGWGENGGLGFLLICIEAQQVGPRDAHIASSFHQHTAYTCTRHESLPLGSRDRHRVHRTDHVITRGFTTFLFRIPPAVIPEMLIPEMPPAVIPEMLIPEMLIPPLDSFQNR